MTDQSGGSAASSSPDLYSLLKISRSSSTDDVHRAYKMLSMTFHPDKLPPAAGYDAPQKERLQQVFLRFKHANDILSDPVLRLAYDHFGDDGVQLIKRIQRQALAKKNRRQARRKDGTDQGEGGDTDSESDSDDDQDDGPAVDLYERLERLLSTNNAIQAREELYKFMDQYEYQQQIEEDNRIHMVCTFNFSPSVVDLPALYRQSSEYVQKVKSSSHLTAQNFADQEERNMVAQLIQREEGIVNYQVNRIREMQQAHVGLSVTSVQDRNQDKSQAQPPPKWSLTVGGSTDMPYPNVKELAANIKTKGEDQQDEESVTAFVNAAFQPDPTTQVHMSGNLSNDQSYQVVLGSSRTFLSMSSFRYFLTFASKSPLGSPLMCTLKTDRNIEGIGVLSGATTISGTGNILQWSLKYANVKNIGHQQHHFEVKAQVGMTQGSSVKIGYNCHFRRRSSLKEYMTWPRDISMSAVIGRFSRIEAMVTQEFKTIANRPTLGFGLEHNISLSCWTWIWEWSFRGSTFRVPIPVFYIGSVVNRGSFYTKQLYYGVYCLFLQTALADMMDEDEESRAKEEADEEQFETIQSLAISQRQLRVDADRQVSLMKPVSDRKRELEIRRSGLVVLKAYYWLEIPSANSQLHPRVVSYDVVTQLQFWVDKGQLVIPALPKSQWMGFYDLSQNVDQLTSSSKKRWRFWRHWVGQSTPNGSTTIEPMLTIRYQYQGHVYELTVGDTESIVLPSPMASMLGSSDMVQ